MATAHNHGSNFGRKVAGCPRCEELKAGAAPITWNIRKQAYGIDQYVTLRDQIRQHDCKQSKCGVVCTAFDW